MLTLVQVQFNLLGWLDSNQRLVPYERTALATELHPKMQFPNVFGIDLFVPGLVITTFSQIPKKINIDHLRSQSWLSVRYCMHPTSRLWDLGVRDLRCSSWQGYMHRFHDWRCSFPSRNCLSSTATISFRNSFSFRPWSSLRLIIFPSSRLGRFTSAIS